MYARAKILYNALYAMYMPMQCMNYVLLVNTEENVKFVACELNS